MLKKAITVNLCGLLILSSSMISLRQRIQQLSFEARRAVFRRDYEKVGTLANELMEMSSESEPFGRYFQALALSQQGKGNRIKADEIFRELLNENPPCIKAASLLALGASSVQIGDYEQASDFITKSAHYNTTESLTSIFSESIRASIYSLSGDYISSLSTFHSMLPRLNAYNHIYPAYVNFELNNFAYDLYQFGEVEAARQIIKNVLQSPFITQYPEWKETADEIFVNKPTKTSIAFSEPQAKAKILEFRLKSLPSLKPESLPVFVRLNSQLIKFGECYDLNGLRNFLKASTIPQRGENQK